MKKRVWTRSRGPSEQSVRVTYPCRRDLFSADTLFGHLLACLRVAPARERHARARARHTPPSRKCRLIASRVSERRPRWTIARAD